LSFRRLIWFVLAIAAACGATIPPDVFSGEPVRMLVTFLGLVSASILPTISLAIGNMSGTGRSVKRINELNNDLIETTNALFRTMKYVGCVFVALVVFSMLPHIDVKFSLFDKEFDIPDAPRRFLQLIVFMTAVLAVCKAYEIPRTFLKVLNIKHQIAVYEARKAIDARAPGKKDFKDLFPTGKTWILRKMQANEQIQICLSGMLRMSLHRHAS
jgi:hypothetical protein